MTRPLPSVVTPYHSPSGASLSQFSLFLQFGPPVALYKAVKASTSPVWIVATHTGRSTPRSRSRSDTHPLNLSSQENEVPQFRWYRPAQLVLSEGQHSQVGEESQL